MITQQAKSQFCEVPIKLPIFPALPDSFATGSKSPRSFAFVGLGIVAAMGGAEAASGTLRPAGAQARSDPIPIAPRERCGAAEEEMELSESYTCVISHTGRGSVRKKVYYCMDGGEGRNCGGVDMDMDTDTGMCDGSRGGPGLFYQSSPATPVAVSGLDFLKCCWRCGKRLEGIDIFMYRGEKAFCSPECRQQQIMADEYRTPKSRKPFDFSASPCSTSMLVAAGVAAA